MNNIFTYILIHLEKAQHLKTIWVFSNRKAEIKRSCLIIAFL